MLKVTFLEFILRGIPEGFLFFVAIYAFTKNSIQLKRYLLSSILYSVAVYLIKFLPIQNGSDSILNLIVLMTLAIIVNKIDIIKAIKASIIIMLIEFIVEGINVFVIQHILKKNLIIIFNDPKLQILYSSPSLLVFGCIAIVYYIRLFKRKELNYISYGEINK